jgi:hypothetical protein
MKYTKSDLQLSDKALMGAIIQIGKELQKRDTPRSRALNTRLLENFNKYDTNKMTTMLNNFQRLLVDSISNIFGTLNAEDVVKNKLPEITNIIMSEP